jgi:hypothetical protein
MRRRQPQRGGANAIDAATATLAANMNGSGEKIGIGEVRQIDPTELAAAASVNDGEHTVETHLAHEWADYQRAWRARLHSCHRPTQTNGRLRRDALH